MLTVNKKTALGRLIVGFVAASRGRKNFSYRAHLPVPTDAGNWRSDQAIGPSNSLLFALQAHHTAKGLNTRLGAKVIFKIHRGLAL
jgi:hypothetical protein